MARSKLLLVFFCTVSVLCRLRLGSTNHFGTSLQSVDEDVAYNRLVHEPIDSACSFLSCDNSDGASVEIVW